MLALFGARIKLLGCRYPATVTLFRDVIAKSEMKIGGVMHELGRNCLTESLGMAMNQGSRLQQDLIDDLEAWLSNQVSLSKGS